MYELNSVSIALLFHLKSLSPSCYREPCGLQGVAITDGRGTYVHSVNQGLPVSHLENGWSSDAGVLKMGGVLMLFPAPKGFSVCHLTDLCYVTFMIIFTI